VSLFDGLSKLKPLSVAQLHRNYVDCVRFYGDLIVSKSTEEEIVLWQARRSPWGGASATDRKLMALKLATFKVPKCDVWFIRFALCPARRLLAVGTTVFFVFNLNQFLAFQFIFVLTGTVRGELLLIDLASAKTKTRWYQLKNCVSTVRGIAFNHDGRYVLSEYFLFFKTERLIFFLCLSRISTQCFDCGM
jgi:hypothetical protein